MRLPAFVRAGEVRPLGVSLVVAACLAGLLGVAGVLFAQGAPGMQRYLYREIAGAALGLGLALLLSGAAASLPIARAGAFVACLGGLLCLGGVGGFVALYPWFWNVEGRDFSWVVIGTYGFGLALLVGAMTRGLVAAYVEVRAARAADEGGDEVSEEEVLRDLEETTARTRLTWGGVRVDERELTLAPLAAQATPPHGSLARIGVAASVPAWGLDEDVDALLHFRGARTGAREAFDESTTEALVRLRQEREAQRRRSFWHRLRAWLARTAS